MTSPAERSLIIVGLLPLIAAGIWLTLLRRPDVVAARPGEVPAAPLRDEPSASSQPEFVGVVLAGQDATLAADLDGEVTHVFAEPGARVRRGDPLLQLCSPSIAGAANMASAQAREDRSALEAARLALQSARDKAQRMARAEQAFPARELSAANTEAARAAAELARLEGSAGLHRVARQRELARADKQLLRAPFDGVLAARFVDTGDHVSAGQELARVLDETRFVRFATPEAEHTGLEVGALVRVHGDAAALPLTAAVVDIDPELDPAAALGFARAALQLDPAGLALFPPGSRVQVALPEPDRVRALRVRNLP